MRVIGHLPDEASGRVFGDYLYVQGIENQVEMEPHGCAIWVRDEDKLERAAMLLEAFRANPGDPKYVSEGVQATELRNRARKAEEAYRKKTVDRRHLFRPLTQYGVGPLTLVLIVLSVLAFILFMVARESSLFAALLISEHMERSAALPEIRHGQLWRLITPMFIHWNVLHIFFNMLWLRDLGSMIENRQSTGTLAWLVFVIAALSNAAQYFTSGPVFGGMSGVVYGLLGYIWIRGKFDPGSGLFLHQSTVTMMLIWFVLCFTGLLGSIANTAHTVGLVMGVAWGYFSSLKYR